MWHKWLMTAGFAMAALVGVMCDEQDDAEIKALAEELRLRARLYAEDGNTAAAAEMEQRASAVLLELERRQLQSDELVKQRRMEELRRVQSELERHAELLSQSEADAARKRLEEIKEQMLQNNAELRRLAAGQTQVLPRQAPAVVKTAERLEHLQLAIEHLRKAGQDDLAEEVTTRAAALERKLHPRAGEPEIAEMLEHVLLQMEELRSEVSRLRTEVDGLRRENEAPE